MVEIFADYSFFDDAAKNNPFEEDRLNRAKFSQRIASAIIRNKSQKGYVIGLQGIRGSGKSTLINFIKHHAREMLAEEPQPFFIVDYSPWMISGHRDLASSFFKVLSEEVNKTRVKQQERKRFGLSFAKVALDPLLDALASMSKAVDPTQGILTGAAKGIAKETVGKRIDRWLAEPSLQKSYEELVSELSKENKRFLVVIDDLDRLEKDEVIQVLRMVKTIGGLPNVTYLLSYDKNAVSAAISDNALQAEDYLDKIVQHEIDLPPPDKNDLLAILDEGVGGLLQKFPESVGWHNMLQSGLRRWIQSPRDVARLINATNFSVPALSGEVDPQDVLIMEAMRLNERVAFDWIRNNREFIFGIEGKLLDEQQKHERGQRLRDLLGQRGKDGTIDVICYLLPSKARYIGDGKNHLAGSEAQYSVRRRGGIGSENGYDTYFSLYVSDTQVAKSDIDLIFANINDGRFLDSAIKSYLHRASTDDKRIISYLIDEIRIRLVGHAIKDGERGIIPVFGRSFARSIFVERYGKALFLCAQSKATLVTRYHSETMGH